MCFYFQILTLGVWLSDDLRWYRYIEVVTKRASKQVGMILRRFSNPEIIKQLYISFVRSHLEYAVQVWDPYHATHINALEKVQKFASHISVLKHGENHMMVVYKGPTYHHSVNACRKFLKLSYLFQVTNCSFHFQNSPMTMHMH